MQSQIHHEHRTVLLFLGLLDIDQSSNRFQLPFPGQPKDLNRRIRLVFIVGVEHVADVRQQGINEVRQIPESFQADLPEFLLLRRQRRTDIRGVNTALGGRLSGAVARRDEPATQWGPR